MTRLNLCLLLFILIFSGSLFGQSETEITLADLNGDGNQDSLRVSSSSGSGFGSKKAVFTDGKTGLQHTLQTASSFGTFIALIKVPEWLAAPEQKTVLAAMTNKILPPPAITPDPSLRWILNGRRTKQELTEHQYFNLTFDPNPKWLSTQFYLPGSYFLPYGDGTYAGEVPTSGDAPEKGLLVYYGHNHKNTKSRRTGQFIGLTETPGLEGKIFQSWHGLVQTNEAGQQRWLFVTDAALTGAPDKLRWSSIGEVKVWDDRLLILQHRKPVSGGESIFLIDLKTGRTARLRNELFSQPDDFLSLKLEGDELLLKGTMPGDSKEGGTFQRFSLKDLAKGLQGFD